jgi:hypothetical protein
LDEHVEQFLGVEHRDLLIICTLPERQVVLADRDGKSMTANERSMIRPDRFRLPRPGAEFDLIASGAPLQGLVFTRFLSINRYPLARKML